MKTTPEIADFPAFTAKVARKVIHFPTLETVLMVENFLYKNRHKLGGKYQIWKQLPQKPMYQTYLLILAYLEYSGKIMVDRKGGVAWVWDPEGIRKYLKQKGLEWHPAL